MREKEKRKEGEKEQERGFGGWQCDGDAAVDSGWPGRRTVGRERERVGEGS